ncbi:MAG: hypothetical protein F4Y63_01335 [Chloroflexi bacterium]|nr:hypothetical protein [Chloroflexota bacterium]MYF79230.1 hypothetical protein [Chloroflexota bacterium]MYK60734.1 hypothetical protein [Chloroflexota bacterium]
MSNIVYALFPRPSLLFVLVVIATVLVLTQPAHSVVAQSPEDTVTISGQVVNGTEGGESPAELTVFVLVIDESEEAIVERVETVTGINGTFALEVVEVSEPRFYRVVVDDGIYTPYVDVLPDNAEEEVTLTVYDSTTSLDEISVTTYSIVIPVIDGSTGVLGVLAAVNLVNSGDTVYLADLTDPALTGFKLLRFNLPEGYQELTVESDLPSGNVMEISTGFAISNPVPPGEYNMVISYTATFDDGKFAYPFRLPFGAGSVSILIPEDNGTVSGLGLQQTDTVTIGDERYVKYEGTNYERSSELDIVITGLPKPDLQSQVLDFFESVQFRIAIIVSVALAMIAIVAYVIIASRRHQVASVANAIQPSGEPGTRSATVAAIAELDEMHELGKIDEGEYSTRRGRLMREVINAEVDQLSH